MTIEMGSPTKDVAVHLTRAYHVCTRSHPCPGLADVPGSLHDVPIRWVCRPMMCCISCPSVIMPPAAQAPRALPARLPRSALVRWRAAPPASVGSLLLHPGGAGRLGPQNLRDDDAMRHRTGHQPPLITRVGAGVSARASRFLLSLPPPRFYFLSSCAPLVMCALQVLSIWGDAPAVTSRAATADTARRAFRRSAHGDYRSRPPERDTGGCGTGRAATSPVGAPQTDTRRVT